MTGASPGTARPAVSVIVATRNRPELLLRAVTSIIGQSYRGPLDCVVVYDQSDPVALPLEVPAGRRLRVLANARTPGLAGARNTGIAATDGTVVAFCDDDDTWLPDKLSLQVELLEESGADFVGSGVRIHHSTVPWSGCRRPRSVLRSWRENA